MPELPTALNISQEESSNIFISTTLNNKGIIYIMSSSNYAGKKGLWNGSSIVIQDPTEIFNISFTCMDKVVTFVIGKFSYLMQIFHFLSGSTIYVTLHTLSNIQCCLYEIVMKAIML